MIILSLIGLSSQMVPYKVQVLVGNGEGRNIYVLKGNQRVDVPVERTKYISKLVLSDVFHPESLRIVVEDGDRKFQYPVPIVESPPAVVSSGRGISVRVRVPDMKVSDFEDARVYVIRVATDSSSEAFPLVDTSGENILTGNIPFKLQPGSYKLAIVLNDREGGVELRIYRPLRVVFSIDYRFASVPSGFVGFPIYYCLLVNERDYQVVDVNTLVEVIDPAGVSFNIFLIAPQNNDSLYCGSYDVKIPGPYVGVLKGYASVLIDGKHRRVALGGQVKDEILLKYDGDSLPVDKGIKYGKRYKGKIFISNPLGDPVNLRIMGVMVRYPDSIEIGVDVGKEILVEGKTPIDIYIMLKEGGDRNGVYPFVLLFRDVVRGKRYFLPLKLHLGKSGWQLLKDRRR